MLQSATQGAKQTVGNQGVPLVFAKGLNWHSAEWLWNSIQMSPLAFDLEVVEIWLWLQVSALIRLQMFPLLRPVKSDAVDQLHSAGKLHSST